MIIYVGKITLTTSEYILLINILLYLIVMGSYTINKYFTWTLSPFNKFEILAIIKIKDI